MRIRHGAAVLAVALLLAACSQEVQGVASPGASSPPPSSSAPPPPPPSEPAPGGSEPGGSAPDTGERSGPATPGSGDDDGTRVSGINFQSDNSSTRLTVNLSGSGVPEWTVGYSEATGPDGEPIDIAGDAFLRVRVRSDGGGGQGSSRLSISPGPVAEARTTGATDGYEEVLIGVRGGEQPFTVDVLTDPGRLVIHVGS